jgi:hypothetical protein
MRIVNNVDPQELGERILKTKQSHDVSVCDAADFVFAQLATERDHEAVAGNGSHGAGEHPPRPLGSV